MSFKDRNGNIYKEDNSQENILRNLYETKKGARRLRLLTRKSVSRFGGLCLKSRSSKLFIKSFVSKNNINLDDYLGAPYKSYNDFFIRKIKPGKRPIDMEKTHFISPSDSKLMVYKVTEQGTFNIKDVDYTFESLFRSKALADEYKNGYILIFRLCVDDYHRYSYVDSGEKSANFAIEGKFHTVNPIATDRVPVYKENQREYTVIETENFGKILQMEVGAMMVGKIVNYHGRKKVYRGEEKGRFEFGGSTVIVAVKENVLKIDDDILTNSQDGFETKVKLGERVAVKL